MTSFSDRAAELRVKLPLEDYLRNERGVIDMRAEGSHYKMLCAFHDEKTASLQIDAKPGTRWYCHGCGLGGDLITWAMRADGLGFVEALEQLSAVAGLGPVAISAEERTKFEARVAHHRVLDKVNTAFSEWAMKQAGKHLDAFRRFLDGRAMTLDIARQYKIGYVDAQPTEVRKALLDAGCTQHEIEESMLLVNPQMFDKRIVIGVKNHGQIRLIYGRATVVGMEPVHLFQTGTDKGLFNLDRTDKGSRLILTESILDTLALVQLGYEHEAVGALGAKLSEGQVADLKRAGKKIWILYDNDETGRKTAIEVGLKLGSQSHAITQLKGKVKDPNEFLLAGGTKDELDKMLEESKSNAALTTMLQSIDPTTPRHELPKTLMPVIDKLAEMDDEMGARTILDSSLKGHFSMTAAEISPYRAQLAKMRVRKVRSAEAEARMSRSENPDLPENEVDLRELHNGVSYVDGDLWYQFLIQKPEKVFDKRLNIEKQIKATQVWYVSSTRQFRRRDAMKVDDELVVDMTPVGVRVGRWSLSGKTENSIEAWRSKNEQVDPIKTYDEIAGLLHKYLWFPDDRYYDLLAIWTLSTYWLPIWDTVGYLFLHASPRSGKTTTLQLLEHLAYEGELIGDVSGSALFRKIEGSRGAMLLDEMEKLASEEFAKSGDPINQVLLTGYKRSGNTQRTDLDLKSDTNSGAVTFSTFCSKVIANTQGIKVQTIRDRSIELMLLRSDHKLPQFNERRHQKEGTFTTLRNQLYTMALKYAPDVAEIYEDRFELAYEKTITDKGLFGRDYEVWIALWCTAMWLDELGKVGLLDSMIEFAAEHKGSRDSSIAEDSVDAPLLKALRRFIREHRKTIQEVTYKSEKEWYPKDAVLGYLKEYRDLKRVGRSRMLQMLQRLHVTPSNPPVTSVGGKSVQVLRIREQDVSDAIKRYDIGEDDVLREDESLTDFFADDSGAAELSSKFGVSH